MVSCGMSLDPVATAFQSGRGLAAALDQVQEAMAVLDTRDGSILHANTTFTQTFGPADQWVPAQRLLELFQFDEDGGTLPAVLEQLRSGRAWSGHFQMKTREGRENRFEGTLSPVRTGEGAVESMVVRLRDITLRVERERSLDLAHKMSALGAMAGGVAHDFNNLIGAILIAAEQIEKQLEPDSPALRKLEVIQQVGSRARGLTAQILNYSRQTGGNWSLLDLTTLVSEVANVLQTTLPGNVLVRSDLAEGAMVFGDPSQLHQVIMNLGINASQAMQPGGGVLSIQLRQVAADQQGAGPSLPEPCVQLTVEDTGCGMEPRTLERIFDPFFTTKVPGSGTGLGLSVVHDIIQGHGGNLRVSSRFGKGSSFQIDLPVNSDRRRSLKGSRPYTAGQAYSGTDHPLDQAASS